MSLSKLDPRHKKLQDLLRQYRRARALTQLQLAERLGRPQSFIAKYESGERRLDLIEFLMVAEALNIDPVEFIHQLQSKTNDEHPG
jgi:transcriptional regulator with XRE-family HTH domain